MDEKKPSWFSENLVLGWKVTKGLEPEHWSKADAKPGKHKPTDVIETVPKTIANHTVVVAQSGSGKSFFLGRLLEEILLKTHSRVLVLDSNSDFRLIAEAKSSDKWTGAHYDRENRQGFLVEEPTRTDFTSRWDLISKRVYTKKGDGIQGAESLRLDWLKFPADLLAEDAATDQRDQLRHCHNLINILAGLARLDGDKKWSQGGGFLRSAHDFCKATESREEKCILEKLCEAFGPADSRFDLLGLSESIDAGGMHYVYLRGDIPTLAGIFTGEHDELTDNRAQFYQRAVTHRKFVLPDALRFYFSRAFELEQAGLINRDVLAVLQGRAPQRIEVVDLPSIPDSRHQKMAMCTFLEAEWQRARNNWERALKNPAKDDLRVPVFIVVEEAHNAAPDKALTQIDVKLQEQFRRVAAEGRKFGLFLILVSQRPDKLDRMIMSECQNRAVMKVGSSFVLRTTCEVLALDGIVPRITEKVLDFDIGRALLAGPWVADDPTFLLTAARRTLEGGRDLQWKHWAQLPYEAASFVEPSEALQ